MGFRELAAQNKQKCDLTKTKLWSQLFGFYLNTHLLNEAAALWSQGLRFRDTWSNKLWQKMKPRLLNDPTTFTWCNADGRYSLSSFAILLCSLTNTICKVVKNGCSLTLISPAMKSSTFSGFNKLVFGLEFSCSLGETN